VQGPFDGHDVRGVAGEHLDRGRIRRAAADRREGLCVAVQVQRILHHVEHEGVLRQAPVGQPGQERVRQYRVVDVRRSLPQLAGEAIGHEPGPPRSSSAFRGRALQRLPEER
jgi:hypothetical protein